MGLWLAYHAPMIVVFLAVWWIMFIAVRGTIRAFYEAWEQLRDEW